MISAVWGMRAVATAGRKLSFFDWSVQMTSLRGASPDITSRSPAFASGANTRVSLGARRSQSTKMTRLPEWDISCASEAAVVDLPSLGELEVIPRTFFGLRTFFDILALVRSTAILIERIASAYGD